MSCCAIKTALTFPNGGLVARWGFKGRSTTRGAFVLGDSYCAVEFPKTFSLARLFRLRGSVKTFDEVKV